ncbi:MAG TPA: hypothetical protein VHG91_14170 [Longimicrobium sp.]|nr:hypothetical protein [Longimicrobium sp.]
MKGRKAAGVLGAMALFAGTASARPAPAAPAEWSWEGRYAGEIRVASVARVPVVGSERSITRSLLLVDVERSGDRLVHRQRVCDVGIRSSRVRMTVPDAFVGSLRPKTYTASLAGPADARRFTADLGEEALGYDPAVTGGALPKDRSAPGVVDSDGDGEPGATVIGHFPLFGRVRLYVAQRSHLVLHGRQTGPDRIEGGLDIVTLESRTLGASNGIFGRSLEVRPDDAASGFTLVRTAARDCDDLRRQAAALFPAGGWGSRS